MATERVSIIGGGITGASVAYHLASESDLDVVVYDRQSLASETTTKSAAYIGYPGDRPPAQVEMLKYAISLYNEFLRNPRSQAFVRTVSHLDVATTEQGAEELHRHYRQLADGRAADERPEAPISYLSGDALNGALLVPDLRVDAIEAALYRPNLGYARPFELAHEFIERARESGATFRPNTPVRDVTTEGQTVTGIVTDNGRRSTEHVVCAAGPWNRKLTANLGLDLPIKHSLAPAVILRDDTPNRYPSLEHVESGVYLREHSNDRVFVGHYPGDYDTAGSTYDPDRQSDDVPRELLDEMISSIREVIPYLFEADILEEWLGIRSLTPDTNPIIGWTAIEGVHVASFNATGIQFAPAAGKVISTQIIDDEPSPYYDSVSVSRFDGYTDYRG